jgi:hypothetical protein
LVNSAKAGNANRRGERRSQADPPSFASRPDGAASSTRALDFVVAYRPRPPVPGGVSVDPLGEVFIKLFPEGLKVLFAPAAALPALVDGPPAALPVVDDPVDGLTVPTLPVAGPALAGEPPAPPVPPACAKAKPVAKPVESAIAVASANIVFMMFPLVTWMRVAWTTSG